MKVKKCDSCGATYSAGSNICEYCGSVFETQTQSQPKPETIEIPQPKPVVQTQINMDKSKPKFNIWLFFFLMMFGFWPGFIYVIYIINKNSKV